MTTTTNAEQVKINIMTQEQYNSTSKSDSELYVLTDATAIPMDDELSLSSENPVKNSVLTARSNQIQTQLNDKLSISSVLAKLNKAYGWTYRHLNGSGNAYILDYTTVNGYHYSDSFSAQNVIGITGNTISSSTGKYMCLDNQLYYVTATYSNNLPTYTLTKVLVGKNCTFFTIGCAIIEGSLYTLSNAVATLRDAGGWTKVSDDIGINSNSNYLFGIKNDSLYFISNNYATVTSKDSTGVWSDVCGYNDNSTTFYGFGIKDGKLYSINRSGATKISDLTGWSMICGYDAGVSDNTKFGLGICNGALYSLKGNGITLIDDTETWIKINGYNNTINGKYGVALTQSGKLYNTISNTQITQIGSNSTWIDFAGNFMTSGGTYRLLAIRGGNVYKFSTSNFEEQQITTNGNYTKVYNGSIETDKGYCGIFWTGSVTEDVHTVYTVPSPGIGYNTYADTNLQKVSTIVETSNSPYSITDGYYTYNRNSSIDGIFSSISEDSSKQLMSMTDFLRCFVE